MTDRTPYESQAGGATVIYLIATAEEPVTSRDLVDLLGITRDRAREVLLRLYRSGMVHRRGRGVRGDPYEYTLAPREADEP